MKKINLRSVNKIFPYIYPMVLGYCVLMVFDWDILWEIFEWIYKFTFEEEIREWGNSFLKLTIMSVFALNVKLQMCKEVFYEKGKMSIKGKLLLLFVLLLTEGIFAEIIARTYGNPDETEVFFQNSFWLLEKCSIFEILILIEILASALTEEFYFRYILCNCLKKFRINAAVIIILQAVFFMVLHRYGSLDSLNVFIAGIIYGIVLYITGTPVCSWFFHITHNLMAMSEDSMSHILYGIGFLMCMVYLLVCEKVNLNYKFNDKG